MAKEYTEVDFGWENVDRVEYGVWIADGTPEVGYMYIYFKEYGMSQTEKAKELFMRLEFVYDVLEVSGGISAA